MATGTTSLPDLDRKTLWALDAAELWYEGVAKFLPNSVTLGELRALTHVIQGHARGDPVTMKDLVNFLDMPRSTVSRMVKHWVGEGVIVATSDTNDERKVRLRFSDHAFELNYEWVKTTLHFRTEMRRRHPDAYTIGEESAKYFE